MTSRDQGAPNLDAGSGAPSPHAYCLNIHAKVQPENRGLQACVKCLGLQSLSMAGYDGREAPGKAPGESGDGAGRAGHGGSQVPGGGEYQPGSTPAAIRRQRLQEMEETRPYLTANQWEIISRTWQLLREDLDALGYHMFVRLFQTYPDVKGAFGPFRSLSPYDVHYSAELRAHGLRVLSTVETIVQRRSDMKAVVAHVLELGRKHVTFNAKADYIEIVGQQFLFAIEPVLKSHWLPEVEQAWADLFRFMSHVMKEAMML